MVGAGQLARMTHQAAVALGQSLRVLAAAPNEPAALVSPDVTLGAHTDLAVLRAFAAGCDAVTFDHEHVPTEHLRALVADGFVVRPGPDALVHAQDKLVMRHRLAELGIPGPPFSAVTAVADVLRFGAEHGWPCILKTTRGGYDGRGVWRLTTPAEAQRMVPALLTETRSSGSSVGTETRSSGSSLLVEQCVAMRRELVALVARSPFGQGAAWPIVQSVQRDGICVQVLAPAPRLDPALAENAEKLALQVAGELGVVGVLAVELFETCEGLLVNELAMRPHNGGHWTIEGAVTSQFEQHLRAVLDYPLGSTAAHAPVVVMANVLGARSAPAMGLDERLHHLMARFPKAKVHLYGKAERPRRKIGHVTILGEELVPVRRDAELAAQWLATAAWADGREVHA
ncbi:MAG: 5-(carboxyamino)imidazole ribonucleotide synthase [Actinomycetota bacterium]|nr:5-(carboxyamino)imidazole ribonucleotide synthase [Actinomycetota bacterium]